MLSEFWQNFQHNLFKPLLMFFYMGFSVPIIGVTFDYPHVLYQSITIYLLIAIGWHGGEELAAYRGRPGPCRGLHGNWLFDQPDTGLPGLLYTAVNESAAAQG